MNYKLGFSNTCEGEERENPSRILIDINMRQSLFSLGVLEIFLNGIKELIYSFELFFVWFSNVLLEAMAYGFLY